ncbi:hypothetical protein H6S82_24765 [Planktothrix sp. FACHB-1355]|nr:hypothetical protein [Planktothrix sp. FACHB-1355]
MAITEALVADEKKPDDDDSRGSGRFSTYLNTSFDVNEDLVAAVKNPPNRKTRTGRLSTIFNPNSNSSQDLVAAVKNQPNRKILGSGRFTI